MDSILGLFKEWGGHILSGFGIIGGLWAYFRHDRIIKNQEKLLNELQIKQLSKAVDEENKAEIKCNFVACKGGGRIRFVNAGKSDARNVRIEILTPKKELDGLLMYNDWGDYDLINPQSYREESVGLCMGCPDVIKIKVLWDDDYELGRSSIMSVQL